MTDFFTELSGYEGKFGRVTLQKLPLHRYPKTSTRMIGEVTKPNNHASKYFYQDYYVINPTFQDKVRAAKRCQELLRQHAGKNRRTKVVFYPEEEWAKSSPRITWVIKINRCGSLLILSYVVMVLGNASNYTFFTTIDARTVKQTQHQYSWKSSIRLFC